MRTQDKESEIPDIGIRGKLFERNHFLNSAFEYRANPELTVRGGLHHFRSYTESQTHFLADGSLFKQRVYDEQTIGGDLRATWTNGHVLQNMPFGLAAFSGIS